MTATDPDLTLDALIADWRQSGTARSLPDWLAVPEDVYAAWDAGRVTAGDLLAADMDVAGVAGRRTDRETARSHLGWPDVAEDGRLAVKV